MIDLVDSLHRETTAGRLPRVELEILRGRARNKIRRVEVPVFLIGSAHDCDLVLADPAFPEVHTYLYVNSGGVSVRRLGGGPELAVDGREVQSSAIVDGQTLRIGTYEFAVRINRPSKNDRHEDGTATGDTASQLTDREREGISLVRALLHDVHTVLRVESNLKLYVEQDLPWQAITAGDPLLVCKASA
jgi:pSer/pThr/pTyr-binding forkhead associated (FHA) protein